MWLPTAMPITAIGLWMRCGRRAVKRCLSAPMLPIRLQLRTCSAEATERFGPVDVAVSNAAVTDQVSSALEISAEEWDRVYAINVRGSFLFCRSCAQNMMDNGVQGSIVTIGSLVARGSKTMAGAYPSSKAAVIQFTKNLAKCLAPMGIRVNCVSPGVVATEIYANVEKEMMMEPGAFAEWLVEESVKSGQILIPRAGKAEEIAAAVAFLASADAPILPLKT